MDLGRKSELEGFAENANETSTRMRRRVARIRSKVSIERVGKEDRIIIRRKSSYSK